MQRKKKNRVFCDTGVHSIMLSRQHPDEERDCDLAVYKLNDTTTWKVSICPEEEIPAEYWTKDPEVEDRYGVMNIPRKKEYWV